MGYDQNSKTYKLMDKETSRLIISPYIIFNEGTEDTTFSGIILHVRIQLNQEHNKPLPLKMGLKVMKNLFMTEQFVITSHL
jgi:hypothetical protein